VISAQGKIVGCWGLYPMDEGACELRKMYLSPEVRGLGLGKETLRRALSRGKELGFRRMTLETASALKDAIRLYKAAGFRPYRAEHLSSRTDQCFELNL
jgi:GNAT superfamily N-acetyltransferase